MIERRPFEKLGGANHGWLDARHHFSFASYYDPNNMGWGARPFPKDERDGRFAVLASGIEGDADALPINAKARVLGATLKAGESLTYELDAGRHGYLVPAVGAVEINGVRIGARDGAAIKDEPSLTITALEDAELVMVDSR